MPKFILPLNREDKAKWLRMRVKVCLEKALNNVDHPTRERYEKETIRELKKFLRLGRN